MSPPPDPHQMIRIRPSLPNESQKTFGFQNLPEFEIPAKGWWADLEATVLRPQGYWVTRHLTMRPKWGHVRGRMYHCKARNLPPLRYRILQLEKKNLKQTNKNKKKTGQGTYPGCGPEEGKRLVNTFKQRRKFTVLRKCYGIL